MRFTANRKDLLDAVTKASQPIPSRSTFPILESVLCEVKDGRLSVTGSDMEIICIASCNVTDASSGAIAIPAKRLNITLRQLAAEEVTVYNAVIPPKDGDPPDAPIQYSTKVMLESGTGEYSMTGESAKEYPLPPLLDKKLETLELDADVCKIFNRALAFVSTDDLRPAMKGVYIESDYPQLVITTTDGHRLYSTALLDKSYRPWEYILPANALQLALKGKATSIDFGLAGPEPEEEQADNRRPRCIFRCPGLEIHSPLVDEGYPNYSSVIPSVADTIGSMVFRRTELIECVKRVLPFASATTKQIILEVERSEARIKAMDIDFGGEAVERMRVTFIRQDETEEPFAIGLNGRYLLDILGRLDSEYTTFHLNGPVRAVVVNTELDGERLLLMPVRITDTATQGKPAIAEDPVDPVMEAVRQSIAIATGSEDNSLPQCPECEAAVEPDATICPNCQADLEPTVADCIECHTRLKVENMTQASNGLICDTCSPLYCNGCGEKRPLHQGEDEHGYCAACCGCEECDKKVCAECGDVADEPFKQDEDENYVCADCRPELYEAKKKKKRNAA